MNQISCSATSSHTLHCALELSKKSWLLAIQFPNREQSSVYSIVTGISPPPRARTCSERYWRWFADIGRRLDGNFHA